VKDKGKAVSSSAVVMGHEDSEAIIATATEMDKKRSKLRALPSGNSLRDMLVRPGTHLVSENIFDSNVWAVFRAVDDTGDCFFDCISRALNSAGTPGMSVARLRYIVMSGISQHNFLQRRTDYMLNAPDDETQAIYAPMELPYMRQYVMTREHYATLADVRAVYNDKDLDITPIIINGEYGNKSLKRHGYNARTQGLVLSYTPLADNYTGRRFILLYKRGEHYQLMVRRDREMSTEHVVLFPKDKRSKHAFKAIFSVDDIPVKILSMFEAMLVH
jgi:hypothetical protein